MCIDHQAEGIKTASIHMMIVETANVKSAVWAAGHRPGGAVPAGTPQDCRWHLIIIISQSCFRGYQQRRCGQEPAPGRTTHWNVTYNAFKCKDNKWIQVAVATRLSYNIALWFS